MKKVLLTAAMIFVAGNVYASGSLDCDNHFANKILNKCVVHPKVVHPTQDKRETAVGAGVDVILHEGKDGDVLNKVAGEYRYDVNNSEHSAYVVATTKLSDIWAKLKSIFNKEE